MRLSPFLLTILAASSACCVAFPARGQTTNSSSDTSERTAWYGDYIEQTQADAGRDRPESQPTNNVVVNAVSAPETTPPGRALRPSPSLTEIVTRSTTAPAPVNVPVNVPVKPERVEVASSSRREPPPANNVVVNTMSVPTTKEPVGAKSPSSVLSQTPTTQSPSSPTPETEPVVPRTGEESTPQQETPDTIEFDLTPGTTGEPNLELPEPREQPVPTPEGGQPATTPETVQPAPTDQPEARVLVGEVVVTGVEGDLENEVYEAIRTRPGQTATRSQLQEDVNAIYATGFFSNARVEPQDTPLGVRVVFVVEPNPVLRQVVVVPVPADQNQRALPQKVIDDAFAPQYGRTLNIRELQEGIKKINQWYKENGYDLAQVVAAPQIAEDGTVRLEVAEGLIEDIEVRFLDKDGQPANDEGQPIRGRTRDFIITREIELNSGEVFNRTKAERDLRRVFRLGIFEDVRLSFRPGQDPRKVVVVVDVIEKNTGSVAAGAGISSASGLFGTISYQEQNLGGNNQKLGAELQVGQRELLFDVNFTDPWIAGDPYRTSYTVNGFRRRSISLIFDGGDTEVELPDGDRPRVLRLGGGVTFTRPLSRDVFADPEWRASLGLQYQRVSIRNSDGDISPKDELGNDLSFSGEGKDDLLTLQFGVVRDRRNSAVIPTSGSLLRLGVEQSLPVGVGGILFNRLRGSYSYYLPVRYTNFSPGPQALAFNVQAGTVLGDLPPYEAFSLGGSNSVRGFEEGDVGSGRSFIQATAEYRFPIFSIVGGALFVDAATDFGTGSTVPGDPAGVRGKPGSGFGYGLGVRVQSPLGPIRIDYGFNNEGDSRLHFGIGERF
ncbi:BamA/TamA family outer membrane protein [Coleofasciculus sp. FACHB-SPT36]|uniref:BamA/TamA family outer membrane protein n=1 Tax=Cyanophyceae TaxID=3028117 RepID=UPI00168AE527|nr:BamA/TamA family outer membrane protein [Coleofasciculus sp. FACHB-SPT36]MBD2537731.1 BamA/TamA family outer membrane protein [Coleofasciculus sp. FACHB-SPT36]